MDVIFRIALFSLCLAGASFVVFSRNRKVQMVAFAIFNFLFSCILFEHEMQLIGLIYGFSSMSLSLVLVMFFIDAPERISEGKRKWERYLYQGMGVASVLSFSGLLYLLINKGSFQMTPFSGDAPEGEMISQLFNEYYFPFGLVAFFILMVIYSIVIYLEGKK